MGHWVVLQAGGAARSCLQRERAAACLPSHGGQISWQHSACNAGLCCPPSVPIGSMHTAMCTCWRLARIWLCRFCTTQHRAPAMAQPFPQPSCSRCACPFSHPPPQRTHLTLTKHTQHIQAHPCRRGGRGGAACGGHRGRRGAGGAWRGQPGGSIRGQESRQNLGQGEGPCSEPLCCCGTRVEGVGGLSGAWRR